MQQSRSKRARRNPSPRIIKVTVHEKQRVNEEQPTPASSSSRNHDSAAPRQHRLICTGAKPIHQVHGPPKPRATKSMLRHRIHISAIFPPFFRKNGGKNGGKMAEMVVAYQDGAHCPGWWWRTRMVYTVSVGIVIIPTSPTHTTLNPKNPRHKRTQKGMGPKTNEKTIETLTMKQWIEIVSESLLCRFPPELVFYPARVFLHFCVCGLFPFEHAHERYKNINIQSLVSCP